MAGFAVPIVQALYQGAPASGANIYVYQTGTTTPVTIYSDGSLATPISNPIVADSNGEAVFYVGTSVALRIDLKTSGGTLIRSIDPVIIAPNLSGFSGTGADLQKIVSVTNGTPAASKAVVLDANAKVSGLKLNEPVIDAGGGSGTIKPAGLLSMNITSTGTDANTNEKDLATYSLPASTLNAARKTLRIRAWGTTAANANNKTMKLYFGANVITTPTAATNAKNWFLELIVVRNGTNTQVVMGFGLVDTTPVTPYSATGSETASGAITIKATGTNGSASANDIVLKGMSVEMLN
jgi:hypothetical protein